MATVASVEGDRVSFACPSCTQSYSWSSSLPSLEQQTFSVDCEGCGVSFSVDNPLRILGPASPLVTRTESQVPARQLSDAERASAAIRLKRAYVLIHGVSEQTEQFRRQIENFSTSLDEDKPFVEGMWAAFQGRRAVTSEKSRLEADLKLAESEIAAAESIDPSAELIMDDAYFTAPLLRAGVFRQRGINECLWGTSQYARQCFEYVVQTAETAFDHFWLGLIAEGDYDAPRALKHFTRSLELEPDGDVSVSALREANQMRNYKKRFRGSWGTVLLITLLFWPAVPLYIYRKWK